ncbi:universal stress protein [Paraburkholderia sp. ZP32-5]|uniref:universal stress protein n=1 Tax=Paraburkholderia sp. ZP32-5 TaxID=2883245 RepID=UPI001F271731|nr:universal stress protein [Paraburkholderia sp. ZP32-5]
MYERILVALDGSPSAQRAFAEALELARLTGAVVEACCVVDRGKWPADGSSGLDPEPVDMTGPEVSAALEGARVLLRETGVRGNVRTIDAYAESASTVLARLADEIDADLIVMGTHGRQGLQRFLLGSVAESLVRSTDKPVLVVRHDASGQARR